MKSWWRTFFFQTLVTFQLLDLTVHVAVVDGSVFRVKKRKMKQQHFYISALNTSPTKKLSLEQLNVILWLVVKTPQLFIHDAELIFLQSDRNIWSETGTRAKLFLKTSNNRSATWTLSAHSAWWSQPESEDAAQPETLDKHLETCSLCVALPGRHIQKMLLVRMNPATWERLRLFPRFLTCPTHRSFVRQHLVPPTSRSLFSHISPPDLVQLELRSTCWVDVTICPLLFQAGDFQPQEKPQPQNLREENPDFFFVKFNEETV